MKSRERARELARESSSTGAAGLDVSPPAGRAQRVAHCGTTRFLILRGGHFRELCLPPPPPPPHRLCPQRSFPCVSLKFFSLWRLLGLSAVESQDLDPPSKMATVFTQAASTLKLNLHAPKPASRFDDLSFDPMDASPLPARGFAAAGCVQAMPPRRSNSSARAPLVCASLTSEATLHRRGRAPPRRGTKVILTDLRKHDDLNGEVGFIVFKPDDRFDGPSGTASSCATTRTSSSPRDQTCSSTRTHLAPRAASPARPPLSNSSLRPPRRPRRTVDDHPIQSLLDCFKQKLGLTASMCHSVLAQALSESMMQQARTRPRPAPDGLPVSQRR